MTVDFVDSYQPAAKVWSLTLSGTVSASSSTTKTVFVGYGFKGGTWSGRSSLTYSGGSSGQSGACGNLRGSTSSSDSVGSCDINGAYTQAYNSTLDTYLSTRCWSTGSTYATGVAISNAYYDVATGNVSITFHNNLGTTQTLSGRFSGTVFA